MKSLIHSLTLYTRVPTLVLHSCLCPLFHSMLPSPYVLNFTSISQDSPQVSLIPNSLLKQLPVWQVFLQFIQPSPLCNSRRALGVPCFMVTCTVYAMWFCGFAFFCAVIAAAFSTSYMVFAACCLVAIGMAFVALCDLGLWVEPLDCVMCIVDVDALCDTLVGLLSVIQV